MAQPSRWLANGHLAVEARLEDLAPALFELDTGSNETMVLHTDYVADNALLHRYPRQAEGRLRGVGGSLPAVAACARRFTLAGTQFDTVPMTMAIVGKGTYAARDSVGTLGAEVLSRFILTFDCPHERVWFTAGPAIAAPFSRNHLGLAPGDCSAGLEVGFVASGSPAAIGGLVAGDVIVAVDGEALQGAAVRERVHRISRAPAGTTVRFRLRDGSERLVQLAEYY